MKQKRMILLLAAFFLFLCIPVRAQGLEADFEAELLEKSGAERLYEGLDGETRELLSQIGVEGVSSAPDSEGLFSLLSNLIRERLTGPFQALAALIALIILCRLSGCLTENETAVPLVGAAACAAITVVPMLRLIQTMQSTAESASVFLLSAVPVYGAFMAASGSAAAGTSYSFLALAAGNVIPVLVTAVILPVLRMFLALSLVSSVSRIHLERFSGLLYGLIKWLLVLSVTVFSGILSIQTLLNAQVDAVANKAAKLVASTAIPIVGSAFGDAVSVIQNSVQVVKSGVGAFGILAAFCIFAPPAVEASLWVGVCSLGQLAGELFELPKLGALLGDCASVGKAILAVLAAVCTVCVVSAAILLFMKGSL